MIASLIILAVILAGLACWLAGRHQHRNFGLPDLPDDEITGIGA